MALPNTRISPEFKIDEFYVSSQMFSPEQPIMKLKLQNVRHRRNEVSIQTDLSYFRDYNDDIYLKFSMPGIVLRVEHGMFYLILTTTVSGVWPTV